MNQQVSASVLDQLQQASALLRMGQPAQARELLTRVVHAHPESFDAQRMLGALCIDAGDSVRARKILRICLHLRPGDVDASLMYARALDASAGHVEAIETLRAALELQPRDVRLLCALARSHLGAGHADEAVRLFEAASPDATPVEYWMLLGHLRMIAGRPDAAADAFRAWVRLEPANVGARARLAAALADAARPAEAEAEIRHCMATGARSADLSFVLARALMDQARFEESEALLREVVKAQPDHVTAQGNLSELVWMRTGDAASSCAALDAALQAQPRRHALRVVRARLLLNAQRAPDALADIEAGLALEAREPSLLKAAATIALDFDGGRAVDYARRAVDVAPNDRSARVILGNALLAVGEARQALVVATALHDAAPNDGQAVAMLADALRMAGDERYRELLDYAHFVRADYLDTPPGWASLSAYLADLQPAMERAHTLRAHPIGNSLRQGSQVPLRPEDAGDAAIRAFPQAIDGPIRRYIEALGKGPDVMRRRNTGGYKISGMWSVRLRPHGFHVNHYHPEGWLSSACYLHLPPAVAGGGGEGWLKFGEPAFPTRPAMGPEYVLKPEPGLLALFPSYMWHGTIPFAGEDHESRLTIAFDVVPAD